VTKRVDLWHSILWSKYRGAVFSEIHALAVNGPIDIKFYQICETRLDRAKVPVDLSAHLYPYILVFQGDYSRIPKLKLFARVFREVVVSRADLVLLGGYGKFENWVQLAAAIISGKAVGVFCDSTLLDHPQTPVKSLLKRIFFARCRVAFCYGERSAQLAIHCGVPASRAIYPVAAAALPRDYRADQIAALRLSHAAPTPRFLYVGRLSPEKNLERLLAAFADVRAVHASAELRLVGDGPQEAGLRATAERLGLGGSVVFAGSRSGEALYNEYLQATCLVLPSTSEPWGLVVNEALSYGCPAVVSDRCGCVPELVAEGETGLVVPSTNVQAIAAALVDAVERFADVGATAERCLSQVAPFTPARAARAIYDGCNLALAGAI
jgi:glycosyltransferase involved in cell wall biosynthesis